MFVFKASRPKFEMKSSQEIATTTSAAQLELIDIDFINKLQFSSILMLRVN